MMALSTFTASFNGSVTQDETPLLAVTGSGSLGEFLFDGCRGHDNDRTTTATEVIEPIEEPVVQQVTSRPL